MATPLISALGGFSQIGMVIADADKTMHYMTEMLGIGPFLILREITLDNYWYRGASARSPVLTVGLAQAGSLQMEIIQQHDDAPSVYADFMADGRDGCQHLSAWFSDRETYMQAFDRLISNGLRLVQQGGSIERLRFAYFESDIPGQPMIELSESLVPEARGLSDAVAWQAGDGTEQIPFVWWGGVHDTIKPCKAMEDKGVPY